MNEMMKIIKNFVLLSLLISGLMILGFSINKYLTFDGLIDFFRIVINLVMVFDFFLDIPLLLKLVGWVFLVKVIIWSWNATMVVIQFFKTH